MSRPAVALGAAWWLIATSCLSAQQFPAAPSDLEREVGRSEVRVTSAPYRFQVGATVVGSRLLERLEALGYERVRGQRPEKTGQFFFGHERFWIRRRSFHWHGREWPARLIGLELRRSDSRILGLVSAEDGAEASASEALLDPELLAESFAADRTVRPQVSLADVPEHVWRTVLAIEDARFFDHFGLDGRSIARALLRNVRAGEVREGGSTISQQLIKMRDLTPKRTLGRKVSEAMRTLWLEAEYSKEEILQAYLNHAYYGNIDGVAIHGIEAGARTWFSKRARELDLAESAALAAMLQRPNALSPVDDRDALAKRQAYGLERMAELGWATAEELAVARKRGLPRARLRRPEPQGPRYVLATLLTDVERLAPRRASDGRGFVIETTVDPELQRRAESIVARRLADLRRGSTRLRRAPLSAALVALDARTGAVLAWVGGDPANRFDSFDRARRAERQPGSTVKPFVLLEAFERCRDEKPLYPARRVLDRAIEIPLDEGSWQPRNPDGRFRGPVSIREATRISLNIPFVRVARYCGFEATADRFRRVGLNVPSDTPPSFVLGSVEASPVEMAVAYGTIATLGRRREARLLDRLALPAGRILWESSRDKRKVARPATAYLVRDLLRGVADKALGEDADPQLLRSAFGKTGTSSEQRDAWFVGGAGELVVAVWVGIDEGGSLGMSGSAAAGPVWAAFLRSAFAAYPQTVPEPPQRIVRLRIEEESGLLVKRDRRGSVEEVFRRGATPPYRRWFRADEAVPVIE